MRSFKLTLSSLALLFLLCSPAQAQSPGAATVQYVGEAPPTIADNTSQGTDAVNDALSGPTSSASTSASASAESVLAGSIAAGDEDDGSGQTGDADGDESPGPITELPETGGPPPGLIPGVLLLTLGLIAARLAL